ncbi:hypothetical protein MVEN_00217900 [Mycena venus]|uniref:Uncharacterized protein n=1 Tax=Mycena venus TaxID=2733690 RepID=A0A8H6YYN9_9AGAR|nr:hypothetical protein MVEN_00217900 [Mycena venus]
MEDTLLTTGSRKDLLSAVESSLHSLPSLMELIITEQWVDATNEMDVQPGFEFETARRWGEISSTLDRITLSAHAMWKRIIANVWFPDFIDDNLVRAQGIKWFIKTVLTSPELPPQYLGVAYCLGGDEGMAALREAVGRHGVVPDFDIVPKDNGKPVISFPPHP